jgi:hypothetical protein
LWRGLSAVFWGLPLALLAFARHFLAWWIAPYDLLLPGVAAACITLGLVQMGRWHARERLWQRCLYEAQLAGLLVVGLTPFLFLWNRAPGEAFYERAVALLLVSSLILLLAVIRALSRLAAMLPDPLLRTDARLFQAVTYLSVAALVVVAATVYWRGGPLSLGEFLTLPRRPSDLWRHSMLLLLGLVPVALGMAVSWKAKEVVLALITGSLRTKDAGLTASSSPP